MKLSIVVPCYNEAANIPKLLAAYDAVLTRSDIEIILVNDGSKDNTDAVLTQLLPRYQRFLKVVSYSPNRGYGGAVLSGLREAQGEFIGWTHGDLQTPPGDVVKALELMEKQTHPEATYIKGTRVGRPLFDSFFTTGMSLFESVYLKTKLYDINAQPNIFHKSFFATWKNPPTDFSLDLYAFYLARKHPLTVIRFVVPFLTRQHGTSSWNTGLRSKWKFIKRTISFSVALKKRLT